MPIGVNHIESVNVYLVEDGDSVTLVDCGMWQPGEPDDGLTKLRDALNVRGYVLDDISRIIVTHAHIDHYGMAGRLMELTRRRAAHARHDGPGLREVPAPRDRPGAKTRHLQRPRSAKATSCPPTPTRSSVGCPTCIRSSRPPPACTAARSSRSANASGRSCTPRVTPSATSACGRRQTSCCSPAITCCPPSLPRSHSSVVSTRIRSAAISDRSSWSPSTIPRW